MTGGVTFRAGGLALHYPLLLSTGPPVTKENPVNAFCP